jgi:hypothetical protein
VVVVALDFVVEADAAVVENSAAFSASQRDRAGGVDRPALFLHPKAAGDAVARFAEVAVPETGAEGGRPFLFFQVGIRDGVAWEDARQAPNGVRFSVQVDGETVHAEELNESAWHARAVPLDAHAGRVVAVEFRTNAIDGHTAYDWGLFGDPLLVQVPGGDGVEEGDLVLAEVQAVSGGEATLAVGGAEHRVHLRAGAQWLPLAGSGAVSVLTGDATVLSARTLRHGASWAAPVLHVKRPVVEAGRATAVELVLQNTGRGAHPGGEAVWLACVDAATGAETGRLGGEQRLPRVEAGGTARVRWDEVRLPVPGDFSIALRHGAGEALAGVSLPVHVFPLLDRSAPGLEVTRALERGGFALRVHRDAQQAVCVYLEDVQGAAPVVLGSLYPLAHLDYARPGEGGSAAGDLRVSRLKATADALLLQGHAAGQPVTVRIRHGAQAGHYEVEAHLLAETALGLRHFGGPKVRAGDGGFGARKDFAIFPGLEYLEGPEHSSSERDLVFPLSWREVPAPHKVAAPLMAVQGGGHLVGVLWDMHQAWMPGRRTPAAHFLAPALDTVRDYVDLGLFVPGVGEELAENSQRARRAVPMQAGEHAGVQYTLVLDRASDHAETPLFRSGHTGALALRAFEHYFNRFGLPEPSAAPRDWAAEKALSVDAYLDAVWEEEPPGWRHCHTWPGGAFPGHAVPQLLALRDGLAPGQAAAVEGRVERVLGRVLSERGASFLWSNAGCHIAQGELPFWWGHVPEALSGMIAHARGVAAGRENGLWVWRPQSEKYAGLGKAGDHTLGQAAAPAHLMLRAARMSGDAALAGEALEALKQLEQYAVPRGAQMWECPLYQPDILASAYAVRAYCEAYRLTGDAAHLDRARYWAWTGLPFLYLWNWETHPTQRYNVISVIGSTFHTHSWIGLPVVWCGLVYAYAIQDLAQYDDSLAWRQIARGITVSAMHQQYTEGPNRGTYPDSWHMVENAPKPADIGPENILMNGLRLEGHSPEIRHRWVQPRVGARVAVNSAADIDVAEVDAEGALRLGLSGAAGFPVHTLLAPVARPEAVSGAGTEVADSAALAAVAEGWLYSEAIQGMVLKTVMGEGTVEVLVHGVSGR